jgi:hypothetical protein
MKIACLLHSLVNGIHECEALTGPIRASRRDAAHRFAVLMLVTYVPELSLWLPRLVLR